MLNEPEKVPQRSAAVWTAALLALPLHERASGPVEPADLDRECGLCRAPLGAVTVYRLSELARPVAGRNDAERSRRR